MSKEKVLETLQVIETKTLECLDKVKAEKQSEAFEAIDGLLRGLLHRLQFERRWTSLSSAELVNMFDMTLSPAEHKRLKDAKNKVELDSIINEYARAKYFRKCAWEDYLNGVTSEKPFDSSRQEKVA